jgi:hypothetical protein
MIARKTKVRLDGGMRGNLDGPISKGSTLVSNGRPLTFVREQQRICAAGSADRHEAAVVLA